jgi:hypothetical protein
MTFTLALVITVACGVVLFVGLNTAIGMWVGASFTQTVVVGLLILVALVLLVGFAFGVAAIWQAVP